MTAPPALFAKTLRDRRRGLAGWSLGLAALTGLVFLYWPSVRDSPDLQRFAEDLPEGVRALVGDTDFTSPAGYLNGELFAIMVPLLFLIVTIAMGARAIAGEEERGTMDLLMSMPLSRTRMLLEKVAAGLVLVATLGIVLLLALLVGAAATDMNLPVSRLISVTVMTVALAFPFGGIALVVGCATGRRAAALGAASSAAVAAYVVNALAPLTQGLEPIRGLSPFAWYGSSEVLRRGLAVGDLLLLVGTGAALVGLALALLEHRDLG